MCITYNFTIYICLSSVFLDYSSATNTVSIYAIYCFNMQALQAEIILGKSGKFIPYIFMEFNFLRLPDNENKFLNFMNWVELFFQGGYRPADPGNYRFKTCCIIVSKILLTIRKSTLFTNVINLYHFNICITLKR